MAVALNPQAWVRVDLETTSGPQLWMASVRPLDDPSTYEGGFKYPDIESFGDVERAGSDLRGDFEVSTFSFVIDDRYGRWRALAANPASRFLTSQDVTFLLVSEIGRSVAATPRVLFRGQLREPKPLPDRRYQVSATSRIGARYGPVDLDSPVLRRTFTTTDFPNLPRSAENTAVRFLWGERSDEGTIDTNGNDVSSGMVIPTYVGQLPGAAPPTYLQPPTNLQVQVFGPTGGYSGRFVGATIGVTFLNQNGQTTATTVYVPNYPKNPGPDPGGSNLPTQFYALITWTNPNPTGTVMAARIWIEEGQNTTRPTNKLDTNIPAANQNGIPPGGIWTDPSTTYYDNGDDSHFKGGGPTPAVNTALIPGGANTGDMWVLSGHRGTIIQIYASDLAQDPAYAPIPAAEIGTYFDLGPNGLGYEVVINGHTYFGFLASGPRADAAKDGSFPFRVNMCGWHEANDQSLPIIDQAFYVYQDVFTQLSGGTDWQGYQTGARLTVPSFRSYPTVPIMQTSKFDACQQKTIGWLGGLGYLASVELDSTDITWRQFIQDMNVTFFCSLAENHHGQLFPYFIDGDNDPTTGLLFREFIEIETVVNAGGLIEDEVETKLRYQYFPDVGQSSYRSGILELENTVASAGYGGPRLASGDQGKKYTNDGATAAHAAGRELGYRSFKPEMITVTMKYSPGLRIEIGDSYRLHHQDLPVNAPIAMCAVRVKVSWNSRMVTLEGRVRTALGSQWAGPSVPAWNVASAADRAIYWTWGDDNGLLPDGTLASRWQ